MSRRSGPSPTQNDATVKPKDQAQTKQAILLAQDTGHFSLVKAMHLADVITEMNGNVLINFNLIFTLTLSRLLRLYGSSFLFTLPTRLVISQKFVVGILLHAFWPFL